jgi:putative membrane protein
MTSNIRNITRMIWVSVCQPPSGGQPPPHAKGKTPTSELTAAQLRRRKIEAIKLAVSFAFATKHYLREEDGIYFEDYADVLPASFARFDETGYNTQRTTTPTSYAATRDNSKTPSAEGTRSRSGRTSPAPDRTPDATKRVRPKRRKPNASFAGLNSPLLGDTHRTVEFHPFADHLTLPLPLVIAHELARLIFSFRRDGFLETIGPAGANSMSGLVHGMVDQLTAMERVANTPIPASYGIHLKQCVTLYLFALPFTLIYDLGWATIPVVTVVAFTFMGIEGIADEIEMPFGLNIPTFSSMYPFEPIASNFRS